MRICLRIFLTITAIFIFDVLTTAKLVVAATTCPIYELNPVGGVTRGDRFDIPINLNLPAFGGLLGKSYYCANPTSIGLSDLTDPCALKSGWSDADYKNAGCQYVSKPPSTCADDASIANLVEVIKTSLKDDEIKAGGGGTTSSNVRNEADFHEITNVKLRTPTQAGDRVFVDTTTGETARKISECKVYYAACFKVVFPLYKWDGGKWVPDTKITTGWFTQTKDDPLHCVTTPSFKKEANITENLQTSITQVPGEDPAITKLKNKEPSFNNDGSIINNDQTDTTQDDFPKMELSLASRRVDTSSDKYLIYWKFCTARGTNSCDIKNYVADLEEISNGANNGQVKIATTPNIDWGDNTSTAGGNPKCFMTGDFNTHPIEVKKSAVGDYYTLKAKVVGQPSDSTNPTNAHCQNSAEVVSSVFLNDDISRITLSGSSANLPKIAACPDTAIPQKADTDTNKEICIMGNCFVSTISKVITGATERIKSYFNKAVTYDSPKETRDNCESLAKSWCGDQDSTGSEHLSIDQVVTPYSLPSGPTGSRGRAHVKLTINNSSSEDAENIVLTNRWYERSNTGSAQFVEGPFTVGPIVTKPGLNAIQWTIPAKASGSPTIIEYDVDLLTDASQIYRLVSSIAAQVVDEGTTSASYENASFLVKDDGTFTPLSPVFNNSPEGLKVLEAIEPPAGTDSEAKIKVTVTNDSAKEFRNIRVVSSWDQEEIEGQSKEFASLAVGASGEFSYTVTVDPTITALYTGKVTATASYNFTKTETGQVDKVAVVVGNATGADVKTWCQQAVWYACYIVDVLTGWHGIKNRTFERIVTIHYYPYFSTAYSGQLQTNTVSPKDGYFNAFTPPNAETKPTMSKQNLSTTASQTKNTTYPLKGQLPDKSGINDLWMFLTPPGQTKPVMVTAPSDPGGDSGTPVTFSSSGGSSSGGGEGGFGGDDTETGTPRQINTDVKVDEVNKQRVIEYVMNRWPNSKIADQWDYVYNKALSIGYNPAFIIALWIEESGASHYTNAWDFGCTGASKYDIDSGLSCLAGLTYKNATWEEFSCRYSEGHYPCEYNINEGFPRAIDSWYQRVVFGIWP